MTSDPLSLIVGVDGGGTKTAARVAAVRAEGTIDVLGGGYGGPSNVRAVGPVHAKTNLDVAINAAHEAAGTRKFDVDYAVLALAGSALPDVQSDIHDWSGRRKLAAQVDIVHDADRAAIARLELPNEAPLALAGGVACSGEFFRAQLLGRPESLGIRPEPVTIVTEPVQGSLILARDRLFAGAHG